MKSTLIAAGVALAAAGLATQAAAHAHLVTTTPLANAAAPAPRQLALRFSERLQPRFSGLAVTMPRMNNMAVPMAVAVSKDGKSLVATPAKPLSAGLYRVSWRAVTADTHRVQGAYTFTVR